MIKISVTMNKKNIKTLLDKALFKSNSKFWLKQKINFDKVYRINRNSTKKACKLILNLKK